MTINRNLLEAALVGYQSLVKDIDAKMTAIRQELREGERPTAPVTTTARRPITRETGKHWLSKAARRRIGAAQRKRWADYRRNKRKAA